MTLLTPPNAVITYDDTDFKTLFPEFIGCLSSQGSSWFLMACTLCDNSASNPLIRQASGSNWMLQQALYYLTAHIGFLEAPRDPLGNPTAPGGSPAPQIVGRISSASEGSVSVSTEFTMSGGTFSQAWYSQTKYGAQYWELTKQTRTFQYFATPTIVPGARRGYGRRGWGGL